jgi:SnoaL-like polyketide cyclase
MGSVMDRVLPLWLQPLGERAEAAFRTVCADPLTVNGTPMAVADLVARARALQGTYENLECQVLDEVQTPTRAVVAFVMRGRQVGSLATALGPVAPTGRIVETRVIDILQLTDGLITGIWMVADELGALRQLDAVRLVA